jgi:hypothetical protein
MKNEYSLRKNCEIKNRVRCSMLMYLNRDGMEKRQNAESQRKINKPFYHRKKAREATDKLGRGRLPRRRCTVALCRWGLRPARNWGTGAGTSTGPPDRACRRNLPRSSLALIQRHNRHASVPWLPVWCRCGKWAPASHVTRHGDSARFSHWHASHFLDAYHINPKL